eukprot:1160755-Pelagomonas_calceolata.AAC.5
MPWQKTLMATELSLRRLRPASMQVFRVDGARSKHASNQDGWRQACQNSGWVEGKASMQGVRMGEGRGKHASFNSGWVEGEACRLLGVHVCMQRVKRRPTDPAL